ncbi:MAG: hypothetical protein QOD61_2815 [Solirubrobacteraceae bacterium]|nr:hypothetical protein [Solirubrobacteraceae bacterium]
MKQGAGIEGELAQVIRLAARDPAKLEGKLTELSGFHRVSASGEGDEPGRVHYILHELIPAYLARLPPDGREWRAIRVLFACEDADGRRRTLDERYREASEILCLRYGNPAYFARWREQSLLRLCAQRFSEFDHRDRQEHRDQGPAPAAPGGTATVAGAAGSLGGIKQVHDDLDPALLIECMAQAEDITILNTWIAGLDMAVEDALVEALTRGAEVSMLMLHPDSPVAWLRSHSLRDETKTRFDAERVKNNIVHCLEKLATISRSLDDTSRRRLRVWLYNSLPSVAIHRADDRAFLSVFTHGQLAVNSVQIEVDGRDTVVGQLVSRELNAVGKIAQEIKDISQWQAERDTTARQLGIDR